MSFASFGNPGYSTIKFAFVSIYVNYETSQCGTGFLIILLYGKNVKTEHPQNMQFRKTKLGTKKLEIISLQEPNTDLSNCYKRHFLLQQSSVGPSGYHH